MTLTPTLLLVAALGLPAQDPTLACEAVQPTAAQRRLEFDNAVALGPFAIRSLSGEIRCDLAATTRARCALRDPRLVHITRNGRHLWFEVPPGRSAEINFTDDVPACRLVSPTDD